MSDTYLPDGRRWRWSANSIEQTICARKYEYYEAGWRPKEESINLTFGGIYAGALETYHKERAAGKDFVEARRSTLRQALQQSYGKLEGTEELSGGARYKSRQNLIRSIIWYLEEYQHDPCSTVILDNGKAAVELNFKFEIDKDIMANGKLDRVVVFQGDNYIQDQKTTGSALGPYYFKRYSPHPQMSMYSLASQVVFASPVKGVMIDAAQIAQGFTRFARGFAYRTDAQLQEWIKDTIDAIHKMWEHTLKGYYPMKDSACMMYGGCEFQKICSKDPRVRQDYLEAGFEKVQR